MRDKGLTRVLDQVKLAPEREKAILADLLREKAEVASMKQTTRRRIPAAALAAAALAVVLAGTAFAAVADRLSLNVFSDGEEAGYIVTGAPMTKYPLSAFSPALLEASEARGGLAVVKLHFDTWDEVQDFVGVDCAWPDSGKTWTNPYCIYLFHTGSDQLWGVEISSTQTAGAVLSEINIQIRTEYWQGENAEAGLNDSGSDGTYTQMDSYLMSNGMTAELVQYTGSEDFPHANCGGYFMMDGILYSVTSCGATSTLEETVSRLHGILDAFS